MIVRDIAELMVLNDEAHHIHDPRMAWFKSIEDIHNRLKQKGAVLSMQVDTTATPRHNNGAIFVQTVADYPLVEAISQNVVKHPVLPDAASRAKLGERPSAKYTEKYADYIDLGVIEWRKAYAEHEKMGKKAILFVMTDDTRNCDDVAAVSGRALPGLEGRRAGDPHQEQRRYLRIGLGQGQGGTGRTPQTGQPDRRNREPLQGHRLGDDAQRGVGRAERHDHRGSAGLFGDEQHPARADAGPRPAEDVSRRRGRVRERGRHECLHGVRGIDPGRRRGAGAEGDGRRDGAEDPAGGRGRRGERAEGPGRAGHRNPAAHAAGLPGIQEPGRPGRGGPGESALDLSRIQRRAAAGDRLQGHHHRRDRAHHLARCGGGGRLSQRDRLFCPKHHEGPPPRQRLRRAVRQGQGLRAGRVVRPRGGPGRPEHLAQPVGIGRHQDAARRLQEGDQLR